MLPDLIMHPERDQQTSEPSLSWASEQEELQIQAGNTNSGEEKKNKNKNDELTYTAVDSDQHCHLGTPTKGDNNY